MFILRITLVFSLLNWDKENFLKLMKFGSISSIFFKEKINSIKKNK